MRAVSFALALIPTALAAGSVAAAFAGLRASRRRSRALSEQLGRFASRLEELEQAMAHLAVQAEVAENVLIEKGVADEQDLESARRSLEARVQPGYVAGRDGGLH
jgi:hypothetical protein